MSNNTLYLTIAGGALALLGLGTFIIYKNSPSSIGNVKQLTKTETIQVLKELKKELYSAFTNMAAMVQQIKEQSQGRAQQFEIKDFVLDHPMFQDEIKKSISRAYQKYQVQEKDLKHACENIFKDDSEVNQLQKEIKSNFENAALGKLPESKTQIPSFLTPEKAIQILQKIMKATTKKIQDALRKLQEQGTDINMNDPKVIGVLNSIRMDEEKEIILKEEGLEEFEDSGAQILQYATQKFSMENTDNFAGKMMELDVKHRKSMEIVFQDPSKDVNAIWDQEIDAEASQFLGGMGGMMGGLGRGRQRRQQQQQQEKKAVEEKSKEKVSEIKQDDTTKDKTTEQQQDQFQSMPPNSEKQEEILPVQDNAQQPPQEPVKSDNQAAQ